MCLYSQVRVLCLQVPRLPKDVSVEWHINFDLDKTLLQPYSASKCLNIYHAYKNLDIYMYLLLRS